MKKLTAVILIMVMFILSGCGETRFIPFKNEYVIPERVSEYKRISTEPKTDWNAKYIWDGSDPGEENVWMCMRKTFEP